MRPTSFSAVGAAVGTAPAPDLAELIRRYPMAAPVDLLPAIHRVHAETIAAEQEASGAAVRGAALDAALASGLVAHSYLDLGDPRAAVAQADAALIYADRAESNGARVRFRALQAVAAYWAGWPHEALRYARLGVIMEDAAGTALGMLRSVEARAHALLGDGLAAWDSLRAANAALAAAEPDELDALGGYFVLDDARRLYFEAEARVHIAGGARAAAECAAAAIRRFTGGEHGSGIAMRPEVAAATAVLALAYARQEHLDGVRVTLDDLLHLDPARRTLPVVLSAARVHAELRRPAWVRDPRVRDMQEQLETFCQVPAGAMSTL